jgi:hypothetical protein
MNMAVFPAGVSVVRNKVGIVGVQAARSILVMGQLTVPTSNPTLPGALEVPASAHGLDQEGALQGQKAGNGPKDNYSLIPGPHGHYHIWQKGLCR